MLRRRLSHGHELKGRDIHPSRRARCEIISQTEMPVPPLARERKPHPFRPLVLFIDDQVISL
jgi:hypothetical protein